MARCISVFDLPTFLEQHGEKICNPKGTLLFSRGEKAPGVFLVLSGRVSLNAGIDAATFRIWRGEKGKGKFQDYTAEVSVGWWSSTPYIKYRQNMAGDLAVRWNCKAGVPTQLSRGRFRFLPASFPCGRSAGSNPSLPKSQACVIPVTVGRNITCNHHMWASSWRVRESKWNMSFKSN